MPYVLPTNSKILVYRYGERGSGFRPCRREGVQNFEKIVENCLASQCLYEDGEFPAEDSSIFFGRASVLKTDLEKYSVQSIQWRRPGEISENPQFLETLEEGPSRFDVMQGKIGDCWLVSAMATLTLNKSVFDQVVPSDNPNFDPAAGYCGAFHFRFWQYGRWIDVVIDDRLPADEDGRLIFMYSENPNLFWSCLLEKAYAKLQGSYEALDGGWSFEALEDFTGGVAEIFNVSGKEGDKFDEEMFNLLKKAHERSAFMGCSINEAEEESPIVEATEPEDADTVENSIDDPLEKEESNDVEIDPPQENGDVDLPDLGESEETADETEAPIRKEPKALQGLYKGHAYSITDVRSIELERGSGIMVGLVRIRNPWGEESEWEGAWSDASKLWNSIPDEVKEDLQLTFDADGEFWMSFQDFAEHFCTLEMVHLTAESMTDDDNCGGNEDLNKKKFQMDLHEGAWIRGLTAGGRPFLESEEDEEEEEKFATNPQYIFKIEGDDNKNDEENENCTVMIGLMQKYRRAQIEKLGSSDNDLAISFYVYKIQENDENLERPLPASFFKENECQWNSGEFQYFREVFGRFELPKGSSYVIVPCSYTPDREAEFLLRIFTQTRVNARVNEDCNIRIEDFEEDEEENEIDPEESPRLEKHFKTVAGGKDLDVDWVQLKKVVEYAFRGEFDLDGLSDDACRSMVTSVDMDGTGKVNMGEFLVLWKILKKWMKIFKKHDSDQSGHLDSSEIGPVLTSIGCHVPGQILQSFVLRYGNKDRQVSFGGLISFAFKLKGMIEIFKEKDSEKLGIVPFTLDQWVEATVFG